MKKIRAYKGQIKELHEMETIQLENYTSWVEQYLEWCCDADGRVSAYDRMSKQAQPYFDELERRKK